MDVDPLLRLLPSCLCSRLRRVQRARCLPLRCTLLVHQHAPRCPTTPFTYERGCLLPAPPGHCEFCRYLPDSPTGCVGLAADEAGPRRCTAGLTPASVKPRDKRTEAQTAPHQEGSRGLTSFSRHARLHRYFAVGRSRLPSPLLLHWKAKARAMAGARKASSPARPGRSSISNSSWRCPKGLVQSLFRLRQAARMCFAFQML